MYIYIIYISSCPIPLWDDFHRRQVEVASNSDNLSMAVVDFEARHAMDGHFDMDMIFHDDGDIKYFGIYQKLEIYGSHTRAFFHFGTLGYSIYNSKKCYECEIFLGSGTRKIPWFRPLWVAWHEVNTITGKS